jgi:hypothetical protein
MPYATDDRVSQTIMEGAVEITAEQYAQAVQHIRSGGRVKLANGSMVLTQTPEQQDGHLPPVWENGAWVHPPLPTPEPPTLEELRALASLSRANFKLALLAGGYLDAVEAAMSAPETSREVRIMWEDSSRFERMHPALLAMAAQMGYSDAQMDALFGIA